MKGKRCSQEQKIYALKQVEAGAEIVAVCRQLGVSVATFYEWKRKLGNLGVSELNELRDLRDENRRLKQLVADLTLDKHILQEVISKRV
jgi:putative transposase